MATLIVGAGLVGTEFARRALDRGEPLVFADSEPHEKFVAAKLGSGVAALVRLDVRDAGGLVGLVREHRIDTIVHTAGLIGGRVGTAIRDAVEINVGGTANVAAAAAHGGVRRVVLLSTGGVYDRRLPTSAPLAETFPRGSTGPYANLSLAKEALMQAWASAAGFELVVLRPASIFGLGHFAGGSAGGRRIQRLIGAGLRGGSARVEPAHAAPNEYVYAKDVGSAVDRAATVEHAGGQSFNIGSGCVTHFEGLVDAVRGVFPSLAVEVGSGERPAGRSQPLDITRAREHLGWTPHFTLRAAFADYARDARALGAGALEQLGD